MVFFCKTHSSSVFYLQIQKSFFYCEVTFEKEKSLEGALNKMWHIIWEK